MNENKIIREALQWGVENPPKDYSPEEWKTISEFATYVANNFKTIKCSKCGKIFKEEDVIVKAGFKNTPYCVECLEKAVGINLVSPKATSAER